MADRILVTGGAGFIGCKVVAALLERGHDVRVLDSLVEQVHGSDPRLHPILKHAEVIKGDVRDSGTVAAAVRHVDKIVHLAAEVGVGQSMYAVERYVSANDGGTAVLMQALIDHPVSRVVVASSMCLYGEGLYRDTAGRLIHNARRSIAPDRRKSWDPLGADGAPLTAIATPECKQPSITSVYALTKYAQEQLVLTLAPAYGMEAVALRLFNVYGPGQALSNPYTGVMAIFTSRLLNGQRPLVFEDGEQRRDFVHVEDVARAFLLALEHEAAPGHIYNIGSGQDMKVRDIATHISAAMGLDHLTPECTQQGRIGDIRHCFADTTLARDVIGFRARVDFGESLGAFVEWARRETATDRVADAKRELVARGLLA
jgi:dTDP-L-rhamnose 4-epimerase